MLKWFLQLFKKRRWGGDIRVREKVYGDRRIKYEVIIKVHDWESYSWNAESIYDYKEEAFKRADELYKISLSQTVVQKSIYR